MSSKHYVAAAVVLTCIVLLHLPLAAQPLWLDRGAGHTIAFEFLKPSFKDAENIGFLTSSSFLYGAYAVNPAFSLVTDIPFGCYTTSGEFASSENNETTLGNIYLGIEARNPESPVSGELGLRLPLAPDDNENGGNAAQIGLYTEFIDRLEAYVSGVLPVIAAINYQTPVEEGAYLRLRAAPSVWIGTDKGADTELFALYSAQLGYQGKNFNLIGGFSGRFWINNEDADFSEASWHQIGIAASMLFGKVSPGVSFKLPLDDNLNDLVEWVFGLSLGYKF